MPTAIEKNTQDIAALALTVRELSGSVKLLIDSQKNLSSLLESHIEHTMEINYIKKTVGEILNRMADLNSRMDRLEKSNFFSQGERTGRSRLISGIKDYWGIIALILTLGAGALYLPDLESVWNKNTILKSS